ncbi:MAG: glycosyltransferase family 2 protein [Euryarchaeota archaeon]|nr:glycosyltransferase family 2 protein [Euryarchaeota archaeon]
MKHATNDIIALVDSDNILPSMDWLSRMKNFEKVLSKTVAAVYTAHTYGFAIRGHALPMRDSGRGYEISPIRPKGA